jgi:hypothetical protein
MTAAGESGSVEPSIVVRVGRGTKEFREYDFLQTTFRIDQATRPFGQSAIAIDEASVVLEAPIILQATAAQAEHHHPLGRFDHGVRRKRLPAE